MDGIYTTYSCSAIIFIYSNNHFLEKHTFHTEGKCQHTYTYTQPVKHDEHILVILTFSNASNFHLPSPPSSANLNEGENTLYVKRVRKEYVNAKIVVCYFFITFVRKKKRKRRTSVKCCNLNCSSSIKNSNNKISYFIQPAQTTILSHFTSS